MHVEAITLMYMGLIVYEIKCKVSTKVRLK